MATLGENQPGDAGRHVHARITHREMRNNSGEVLRRVAAGEVLEITNNGQVVAELSPPRNETMLERLRREGKTRPAAAVGRDRFKELKPRKASVSSEEIIADLRGKW